MNSTETVRPNKIAVLIASICVAIGWLIMFLSLLFAVGIIIGLAAGMPSRTPISNAGLMTIFGVFGLVVISGMVYLIIALRLRCPSCGYKFLKNPKGLGPTGFSYHPSCPRRHGINPWGYQIGRFLGTGRIRCINCGEELFNESK